NNHRKKTNKDYVNVSITELNEILKNSTPLADGPVAAPYSIGPNNANSDSHPIRRQEYSPVNTNIPSCCGLDSDFPPLIDATSTIHTHDEGVIDGTNNVRSDEAGREDVLMDAPSSYADKLSPTSLTKKNIRKIDANVPNDVDFDIRESNAGERIFLFKFSSNGGVDSVLRDGLWMIREVPIFLNKWSPSEQLSCVAVWVKFHDVSLVSYARILIEIDACNGFRDNLVMVVPNLEGPGYTKETIYVENKREPPRCILVKQKPIYRPKPNKEAIPNMAPFNKMKKVSITYTSSKKKVQTNVSTSGNGTFSLSTSFEVLNIDNSVVEDVDSGDRIVMSSVQEEG
nr:hypothetical protein [Tanacetum cinerariifolium]